jgi:DNA-binding NtrC family response regulator
MARAMLDVDDMGLYCADGAIPGLGSFEAASATMRSFGRALAAAARHLVPVLLVGETGTGKTSFARSLHAMSPRAGGPFVRIDCPSAAADLAAGAREAQAGTLFLDEVAALSWSIQATALPILDDARPSRPRLVACTSHDLEQEMVAGRFRKEFFYLLDVVELRVPPLRERKDEILPIAREAVAFLARREGREPPALSPALERVLVRHSWPGNVAELLSVMERVFVLSGGPSLDASALPDRLSG